jgi:hypothetical protein
MSKNKYKTKKNSIKRMHRLFYGFIGILILVGIMMAITESTGITHLFSKKITKQPIFTVSGSAETKAVPKTNTQTTIQVTNTTTKNPDVPASSNNTETILMAPSGTFSNVYQNVGLDDLMSSTCNTSPGATCQIFFTNGSTTRSLPKKLADQSGAVYWSWKPSDSNVNLYNGSWHINATVILGVQSQSRDNGSLELDITH